MSKKKGEVEQKKWLGRPGNHLKMGIVGLPNVGKSSLFTVLTSLSVPAENFPFCTIEPSTSRCEVPDERYKLLVEHFKPASQIPAYLTITDIAGLVRGAHEGQGLGNAFLSHIKGVDGIYHVTRVFEDTEISHVDETIDPVRDLDTISQELRLKDVEVLEKAVESMEKVAERVDKTKKYELEVLKKLLDTVKLGKDVRTQEWTAKEIEIINPLQLLTAKTVVYVINMSERDFLRKKNKWLAKIKQWVDENDPGAAVIPCSVVFEQQLVHMSPEEREAYCKEKKTQSMLPKIITTGYHKLHLIHFFTTGSDEVRCWTIREGTLCPQAAGTIHTDFEKGFICAEVTSYDDFKEHGGEQAAKAAGKCRQQGRNYEVKDGDILLVKAGQVNKGKKK